LRPFTKITPFEIYERQASYLKKSATLLEAEARRGMGLKLQPDLSIQKALGKLISITSFTRVFNHPTECHLATLFNCIQFLILLHSIRYSRCDYSKRAFFGE
jgi:hypothetical protein